MLEIDSDHRDSLILYALNAKEDTIDALLRDSVCVPVSPDGCELKKPTELVDPTSSLSPLYSPEDGMYQTIACKLISWTFLVLFTVSVCNLKTKN